MVAKELYRVVQENDNIDLVGNTLRPPQMSSDENCQTLYSRTYPNTGKVEGQGGFIQVKHCSYIGTKDQGEPWRNPQGISLGSALRYI